MKNIIALFLAFFLIACTHTRGKDFTLDDANKVKNGMTREQVIAIMGSNPTTVKDKSFVWIYVEVNGLTMGSKSKSVKFLFDDNGKTYGIPEGGAFRNVQKYSEKD